MALGNIVRKIHFWVGITCGLVASISGLSGAMYVWQPEFSAALNPELLKMKNIDSLEDDVFLKTASSLATTHSDSISKMFLPYREQQTISIEFKNGKTNYYNSENGQFLGEKSASIVFFEDLLKFHRTLFIPKIGKYVTGTSTIVFLLLILLSGIYIWYKTYSSTLKNGFKIKWKSKKKKFNFDLHKVLGVSFFIPLLTISFTGAYFTYNSYYKKALSVLDSRTILKQETQNKNPPSFATILLDSDKSYDLRAIYYLKDANDNYRFRYIESRFKTQGLRKTKELTVSTNLKTISLTDYRNDATSNRLAAQFYPVHTGEIAGLFGRILVFIAGLIPLTLYITGFRIYLSKKRRLRKFPG
ncbi:PepSY domain-containing protein [Flavobacterium sp. LS1P28]|uniref:PepSY domain-containing protein n=1 Tax=Flavobacterium bomense TaxID=2497483 RepID=A0A3S0NXX3_9FLAO|nr:MULTISPECIES: PepSY-associated TM helix domain-containing protein [Flavobacterium]RTY89543.1 PepSY domain-containing protein [Flavobacterium sp. GSN2]RTY72565.1 PepSY domain-containing protein [Flavobacterium sp. LS1R10]RTY79173.1 PepSY domain-containing protein [Flavobacterium sp. LS1P28]RTY84810.1 PepSY domain-containing protein [Flavobacterium sp. ZB4P23]RTZ02072.1 PepSY domain-containing protein [Flavobacterium bomense]